MLKIKNIKFKDIIDINEFNINSNDIVGIIGESGSGKTTLLRLLNNLDTPTKGERFFKEKDYNDIDPVSLRREIVLFNQSAILIDGDIKDNLLLGQKLMEKESSKDQDLKNILKILLPDKELYDRIEKLSVGEKQRICLARVLLMKPKILLLDEPTSSLDEMTAFYVMDFIKEYCIEFGIALIVVTHNKEIARKYCNKTYIMIEGNLKDWRFKID